MGTRKIFDASQQSQALVTAERGGSRRPTPLNSPATRSLIYDIQVFESLKLKLATHVCV